jgi:PKD repeat protein
MGILRNTCSIEVREMKSKYQFLSFLAALLLTSTVLANVGFVTAQSMPNIYVVPSAIVDSKIAPGDEFTVDIMTDQATEMFEIYGWGFYLNFKPSVLEVLYVVPGDFFDFDTPWYWNWKISNGIGSVAAGANFDPEIPTSLVGYGTLAHVRFKVIGGGISLLDLVNTKLYTLVGQAAVPIDHTAESGLFDNRPANALPEASFMTTPPVGAETDTITFDASASTDDGWIVSYDWDFGDRTSGTGKIVQHIYSTMGVYTITLTVTDNEGGTDSAQYTLDILSWAEGGHFPDLTGEMAWPEASVNPNEDKSFNEKQLGEELTLWAKVGNPTDETYQIRVDFKIFSDEGKSLGTVSSAVETIGPHVPKNVPAYFYLADSRWRNYPYWRQKYDVVAYVYHSTTNGMESGRFPGEFWFRINAENHDRAIVGMTATSPVESGKPVTVTVVVENQGWAVETATLVLTVDGESKGAQSVTLAVRGQETVKFLWDTTGYKPDSYYLEVKMSPHPFERDTTDNLAHAAVIVTPPPPPT